MLIFFVVHARHGNQSYGDKSDWGVFPESIKTGKTIIANGDIISKTDVEKLMDCAGVMIGKAALANPRIFAELKELPLRPIDAIMNEYNLLLKKRKTLNKYKKNILNCIYERGILEK